MAWQSICGDNDKYSNNNDNDDNNNDNDDNDYNTSNAFSLSVFLSQNSV